MKIDIEFNSGAQLPLDSIPDLGRLAETHGFGCVWGGEANNKDPTVMLSAVAAVTERIRIGSAVYHILGRTPATLALQAVGLSELSRGRFFLGVGVSNPTIARWHGLTLDHPLGRVGEYLEIVRRAMSGDRVEFEGAYYGSHAFKMAFKPGTTRVPIFLAAFGPKMSRLAGSITDGILINMANPGEICRIVEDVRSGSQEVGNDPGKFEVICKVRCSIAPTHAGAREALSHALTYYALADYYRNLLARMGFGPEVEAMRDAWRTGGFHAARRLITDRLFEGLPLVAATSVNEVIEQLKPYEQAGVTRVILPYVAASDDVVGEIRSFIVSWPHLGGPNSAKTENR